MAPYRVYDIVLKDIIKERSKTEKELCRYRSAKMFLVTIITIHTDINHYKNNVL
ncbi:MAG: hypothetical protein J6P47_06770 [Acetobacter sp.]|nr:hypothetical protein [Acetobacter sp.]